MSRVLQHRCANLPEIDGLRFEVAAAVRVPAPELGRVVTPGGRVGEASQAPLRLDVLLASEVTLAPDV